MTTKNKIIALLTFCVLFVSACFDEIVTKEATLDEQNIIAYKKNIIGDAKTDKTGFYFIVQDSLDLYIAKIDAIGKLTQQKINNKLETSVIFSLNDLKDADNNTYIYFQAYSDSTYLNIWKLDPQNNFIWAKKITLKENEEFADIIISNNKLSINYIKKGKPTPEPSERYFIVKQVEYQTNNFNFIDSTTYRIDNFIPIAQKRLDNEEIIFFAGQKDHDIGITDAFYNVVFISYKNGQIKYLATDIAMQQTFYGYSILKINENYLFGYLDEYWSQQVIVFNFETIIKEMTWNQTLYYFEYVFLNNNILLFSDRKYTENNDNFFIAKYSTNLDSISSNSYNFADSYIMNIYGLENKNYNILAKKNTENILYLLKIDSTGNLINFNNGILE